MLNKNPIEFELVALTPIKKKSKDMKRKVKGAKPEDVLFLSVSGTILQWSSCPHLSIKLSLSLFKGIIENVSLSH